MVRGEMLAFLESSAGLILVCMAGLVAAVGLSYDRIYSP